MENSHYGIPSKEENFLDFVQRNVPSYDSYQIFGLNQNIFRTHNNSVSHHLSEHIRMMNMGLFKELGYGDLDMNLEKCFQKTSVVRGLGLTSKASMRKGLRGPDALLVYFIEI